MLEAYQEGWKNTLSIYRHCRIAHHFLPILSRRYLQPEGKSKWFSVIRITNLEMMNLTNLEFYFPGAKVSSKSDWRIDIPILEFWAICYLQLLIHLFFRMVVVGSCPSDTRYSSENCSTRTKKKIIVHKFGKTNFCPSAK